MPTGLCLQRQGPRTCFLALDGDGGVASEVLDVAEHPLQRSLAGPGYLDTAHPRRHPRRTSIVSTHSSRRHFHLLSKGLLLRGLPGPSSTAWLLRRVPC